MATREDTGTLWDNDDNLFVKVLIKIITIAKVSAHTVYYKYL